MARANTPTLLSLDRFAAIMGINPAHFNQAAGAEIMPAGGQCNDIFYQHMWQDADKVAREDIAREIEQAEADLFDVLGYHPAPRWIEDEVHQYPQHYRYNYLTSGFDARGLFRSINARSGRFLEAGKRAVSGIQAGATVTFSDEDGDGYDETATITAATNLLDKCEIKVYFAGEGGNPEWEIRDPRSVDLSGGLVTFTFWSWQLIDPDLWEQLPTQDPFGALNLLNAIYVTTVDVYREFTDFTEASAEFFFENPPTNQFPIGNFGCNNCGSTGCPACTLRVQNGCVHPRDVEQGLLVAVPATYDTTAMSWAEVPWAVCPDPDIVKIHYRAGDLDQRFLAGQVCDPLKLRWAEAIAWIAVARLPRPLCSCGAIEKYVAELRRDLAKTEPDGVAFILSDGDLSNPFGTRRWEVRAWRRVTKLTRRKARTAVI